MNFKLMARKILYGKHASSSIFIKYLRENGAIIGNNTCFFSGIRDVFIDETKPWLIEIGDNVNITRGVTILNHGYDLSVLMNYYGELYGSSGKVKIGNNVFLGVNATILKGVTIGDNVIIGANSLVNKDVPDNVVYAGNPAKFIMTLDKYREKRKVEYLQELKELVVEYYKKFNKKPSNKILREYFPLYLKRDDIKNADNWYISNKKIYNNFINTEPIFNGIEELYKFCGIS